MRFKSFLKSLINANLLFYVFLLPVVGDVVGTVLGQSESYWSSHYQKINEAAPVYPLLQIHPGVFIIGTLLIWLPITYFLTKKLPRPFNLWAAMALFAGHAYNSVNWLRVTQKNHHILSGSGHASLSLSLIPPFLYVLLIGFIAAKVLDKYFHVYSNEVFHRDELAKS